MNNKIYKISLAAVFAALIYVATMFFTIPLPGNGYANLGDSFIIIAGFILGPLYGILAAGIGAGLADLTLGYVIYAPATFVIKAVMALAVYYGFKMLNEHFIKNKYIAVVICAVVAEIIMVAGYFAFEVPLYGIEVALMDIPGNAVQGLVGVVVSSVVYNVLQGTGVTKKIIRQ